LVSELNEDELLRLVKKCKHFHTDIHGTNSFEQAQVCAGGVMTKEINPHTMESKLLPGLYFAGEVIDVDGVCGGYNLQWAWSTGYIAGINAAKGN
jgi:predicted flavoprotein YhiN